jgi:glutathione S-transferase
MALTLYYHPLASYCQKVLIALFEKDTPFHRHFLDLGDEEARAAFHALWPIGKMPLLRDDGRDRTVMETSIIIEYLDRHYIGGQPLFPSDGDARLEARFWDRFFDLYVMSPMQNTIAAQLSGDPAHAANVRKTVASELEVAYGVLEHQAAKATWIAGEAFSIADCSAAPALFYAGIVAPFGESRSSLQAYFERLVSRRSVERTLAEARPYFELFPLKSEIPPRFLGTEIA